MSTEPIPSVDSQEPASSDQAAGVASGSVPQIEPQEPVGNASGETTGTRRKTAKHNGATDGKRKSGNVPAVTSPGRERLLYRTGVRDRLMQTQHWPKVKEVLADMRADPKLVKLSTEAREQFIWAELDRQYPDTKTPKSVSEAPAATYETKSDTRDAFPLNQGGQVQGLSDIPPGWPPLPANASLAAEIGWVQANRLYVVEELASGGTRVRLDRAHEPAPSRAAIGWLETSIRSYAKYVEVAAKATSSAQDEQDNVRRERLQIEEIKALLAEMRQNPG